MTADEIIDGLLEREGGWRDAVLRPDGSVDPATNMGITLPTLREHADLLVGMGVPGNHSTWQEALWALTAEQASVIYRKVYVLDPGFTPENIPFEPLRVQLIDFGVNSGPERAVRWLQRVLDLFEPLRGSEYTNNSEYVRLTFSGKMDERLIARLKYAQNCHALPLVNDALVAARSYMVDRAVDQGIMRKQDEEGVESRALGFFLAVP